MKLGLILLLLLAGPAYRGPRQLGPFRIDRITTLSNLLAVLGEPQETQADILCYADHARRAYAWIGRMAGDRRLAGDLMLASFPICVGTPVRNSQADLRLWKTKEGIGLGSTRAAVLRAYGKPSYEAPLASDSAALVYNPRLLPVPGPRVVYQQLGYLAQGDELRAAKFGLVHGRVVWIFLTANE